MNSIRRHCRINMVLIWRTLFFLLAFHWTFKNLKEFTNLKHGKQLIANFTCDEINGSKGCVTGNICVDPLNHIFFMPIAVPPVDMNSVDTEWHWSPNVKEYPQEFRYIDKDVIIFNGYSSDHLSHWLINNALPVRSAIESYGFDSASTFRYAYPYPVSPSKFELQLNYPLLFRKKEDFVQYSENPFRKNDEYITDDKPLPLCFRRAIIGTGSRCLMGFCKGRNRQKKSHVEIFRKELLKMLKINHDVVSDKFRVGLLNRPKLSRRVTNLGELKGPLQLLGSKVEVLEFEIANNATLSDVAKIFSTLDVLVTPHGNQMGNAIFMKKKTFVISINNYGSGGECFFQFPMMSFQIRLWGW
jgi:hypothetical protein